MSFRIALAGDSILNRRISSIADPDFRGAISIFQGADLAFTHLETLIHDFRGPELYPAAEGGWSWMRSPRYLTDELAWAGFDAVSLACNHTLDYSYGGLFATRDALDAAHIAHAGTGHTLGEARSPAYLFSGGATVALLSMTSSFPIWSRAGDSREDMPGRPGLNGLRVAYGMPATQLESAKELFRSWGWWVYEVAPGEWWINPPGLHNTTYRFYEMSEGAPTSRVVDEDREANLSAISDAAARADLVVVIVQSHEWEPAVGLDEPGSFLRDFAHASIDAGADVFLAEGSHAPLRGIEIYRGKPIFFDPGDLFRMSDGIQKYPQDFFERHRHALAKPPLLASQAEAIGARSDPRYSKPWNPRGGYKSGRVLASFAPVCTYDEDLRLSRVEIHPLEWSESRSGYRGPTGLPLLPTRSHATDVLEYVASLSARYGTHIDAVDGVGIVATGVER